MLGIPALAVSLAWGDTEHWDTAAQLAVSLASAAAAVPGRVLSLNVPNVTPDAVLGLRAARPRALRRGLVRRGTPR